MAGRRQPSRGSGMGRRDIYVRSDLRPIYGTKKQRQVSVPAIIVIVLVILALGAGAFMLLKGSGLGM